MNIISAFKNGRNTTEILFKRALLKKKKKKGRKRKKKWIYFDSAQKKANLKTFICKPYHNEHMRILSSN